MISLSKNKVYPISEKYDIICFMEKKKIVDTVKLEQGTYLEKKFDNYLDMAKHAVDWTLFCHYKLRANCVEGVYKILKLSSMQISYTKEVGGIMYDFATPKESICISIMINIEDKACIKEMKIKNGMMVITRSEKIYNFLTNSGIEVLDISCSKKENSLLYKTLKPYADKFFYDEDKSVQNTLLAILKKYEGDTTLDTKIIRQIEDEVTKAVVKTLQSQEVNTPHFTGSEQKAMKIREQIFHHMDSSVSVEKLALEHNVSEKSLQTAFKSLFGFTPTRFIRLMKLNLVNHELLKSKSSEVTVLRVARKWGFRHMGRFSAYYREIFLETPSVTLKKENSISNGMSTYCVERREEI